MVSCGRDELIEVKFTVAIEVNLYKDIMPINSLIAFAILVVVLAIFLCLLKLICINHAIFVLVDEVEG